MIQSQLCYGSGKHMHKYSSNNKKWTNFDCTPDGALNCPWSIKCDFHCAALRFLRIHNLIVKKIYGILLFQFFDHFTLNQFVNHTYFVSDALQQFNTFYVQNYRYLIQNLAPIEDSMCVYLCIVYQSNWCAAAILLLHRFTNIRHKRVACRKITTIRICMAT